MSGSNSQWKLQAVTESVIQASERKREVAKSLALEMEKKQRPRETQAPLEHAKQGSCDGERGVI